MSVEHSHGAALRERLLLHGFVGPLPLIGADEAEACVQDFTGSMAEAGGTYSNWHLRFGWAEDLALDPRIGELASVFLGEEAEVWASEFWFKAPGSGRVVPWHQDDIFWHAHGHMSVTVWLALTPSSPEVGGLGFLAGSQRYTLPHRPRYRLDLLPAPEDANPMAGVVPVVPAGSALVFDPRVIHGSSSNASSSSRLAVSFRFAPRRECLVGPVGELAAVRLPGPKSGARFLVGWRPIVFT